MKITGSVRKVIWQLFDGKERGASGDDMDRVRPLYKAAERFIKEKGLKRNVINIESTICAIRDRRGNYAKYHPDNTDQKS